MNIEPGPNAHAPSNEAGGTEIIAKPGVAAIMRSFGGFWQEFFNRQRGAEVGFYVTDSLDNQRDPPNWMEDKNVTVDGFAQDKDSYGDTWWEHKYAKELAIAEARSQKKVKDITLERQDMYGAWRNMMRFVGLEAPEPTEDELIKQAEAEHAKSQRKARLEQEEKSKNWRAFMHEAMETDKPLATVAAKYRNVYDVYGLDDYLDYPASFLWLNMKIGCFLGVWQGGWRAMKLLYVDAHFLQVSGIGVLAFINTSILAGLIKWAGNATLCAAMFSIGDRAVTGVKQLTVTPRGEWPKRTPVNYSVGMACSFGVAGILPWWMLGDAALAIRYTMSGAVLGGVVGYALGLMINNLIALNLGRLTYTPGQFRAYQSLVKVERRACEAELERRKMLAAQIREGMSGGGSIMKVEYE